MNRHRFSLAIAAALVPFALLALPISAFAVVGAGDVAPNFTKTDQSGVVRSLSDYSGKVVLLFELGYS